MGKKFYEYVDFSPVTSLISEVLSPSPFILDNIIFFHHESLPEMSPLNAQAKMKGPDIHPISPGFKHGGFPLHTQPAHVSESASRTTVPVKPPGGHAHSMDIAGVSIEVSDTESANATQSSAADMPLKNQYRVDEKLRAFPQCVLHLISQRIPAEGNFSFQHHRLFASFT